MTSECSALSLDHGSVRRSGYLLDRRPRARRLDSRLGAVHDHDDVFSAADSDLHSRPRWRERSRT